MPALGLTKWLAGALVMVVLGPAPLVRAEDPSLGEKIERFFATPAPTPRHRPAQGRKSNPTPSPSPGASPRSAAHRKHQSSSIPPPKRTKTPSPTPEESPSPSPGGPSPSPNPPTKVATVSPDEIDGYEKNPGPVRKLLDGALALTKRNLDYTYGSADPGNGGMDCSGFIYYVLRKNGVKDVPRDASEQYVWVRKAGNFRAVLSRQLDSFELDELKPGDLLFWTGTYSVERDPPITHTMIYLGKEKKTGRPIMVGASDGRTYEGEQEFGVSVFDFKAARARAAGTSGDHPRFVGYGKIPGLKDGPP